MEQVKIALFLIATMSYMAAGVLYIYFFASKSRRVSIGATGATGLGFVAHTAALALRWAQLGRAPIEGLFNSLMVIAWWVVLAYFLVEHLFKIKTLGIFMVPVAVALMAVAGLNYEGPASAAERAELLRNPLVMLHVPTIFAAYASFAVAGGVAVLYLIQERQLKKKKLGSFFRRLPTLHELEDLERRAALVGVPFLTVALTLGIIMASLLVKGWLTSPFVILAIITLAYYAAYLLLRRYAGWAGRRAAWMAIGGLALITTLMVVGRGSLAGFHGFGG